MITDIQTSYNADGFTTIDVWEDDNECGHIAAVVHNNSNDVFFFDNGLRYNEEVNAAIKEVQERNSLYYWHTMNKAQIGIIADKVRPYIPFKATTDEIIRALGELQIRFDGILERSKKYKEEVVLDSDKIFGDNLDVAISNLEELKSKGFNGIACKNPGSAYAYHVAFKYVEEPDNAYYSRISIPLREILITDEKEYKMKRIKELEDELTALRREVYGD